METNKNIRDEMVAFFQETMTDELVARVVREEQKSRSVLARLIRFVGNRLY